MLLKEFNLDIELTKYIFFTGKGGVGKTSIACSTAVGLADKGHRVMLISTDPASNLQDVFARNLDNKGVEVIPGLVVANFDPEIAAREYRESVISGYRGKLPDEVITNMEEQLSGSCTVEIAAFNEFTHFITDQSINSKYDYVIFDTAPTGHTLRMLQLPSAWSNFISENVYGASCLGQLSGLEDKKEVYKQAMITLADASKTSLILVARPDKSSLKEASRAASELQEIGIKRQTLIVNGVLDNADDDVSQAIYNQQQQDLKNMPNSLLNLNCYQVSLRPYNISGMDSIRALFTKDDVKITRHQLETDEIGDLKDLLDDLVASNKRVIFTMGKGGVGKTTIAAAIALGLANLGKRVHLATTDPAQHLSDIIADEDRISYSYIDEDNELELYKEEVLSNLKGMSKDDIAYIEEDLRSPCTQEIAVFRAFAKIVDRAKDEIVVIDTAPTGHTLLLLDATQSYHKEIERTHNQIPEAVRTLLPKLRDKSFTEVVIVTLPEATPVFESQRLMVDLERAGIYQKWWVINSSFYANNITNKILKARANNEIQWINKVNEISNKNFVVVKWIPGELTGKKLTNLYLR